jgi:hypothetical protein
VRDFLQRAIEEDRFLPAAIKVVTEYAEVKQCWAIFCARNPEPTDGDPTGRDWSRAARRLLLDRSGSALEVLSLFIEMYDRIRPPAFLAHVRSAINDVGELSDSEIQLCRLVLEQLTSSLLPLSVLDEAKRVVSSSAGRMLADYGWCLVLEDIESLASVLYKYGWDQNAARAAAREALDGYIGNMDSTLNEIHNLDELDGFERDLWKVMNEYDLYDSRVERDISYRRETLFEREDDDRGRYGGTAASSPAPQSSDNEIKSMFQALVGR